jgi:glycosyltransferase involved in cell wall biosynthesis
VLVERHATSAFAEECIRLLGDPMRRAMLSSKGLLRARNFTWQKTAEQTLKVYQMAASQGTN